MLARGARRAISLGAHHYEPAQATLPALRKAKSVRPLQGRRETANAAAQFHRDVFAAWGTKCYFGWDHHATDAAHITPRSKLGSARYACAEENGRPLCRRHHDEQEAGKKEFALRDRIAAVRALNKVLRVKLPIPRKN